MLEPNVSGPDDYEQQRKRQHHAVNGELETAVGSSTDTSRRPGEPPSDKSVTLVVADLIERGAVVNHPPVNKPVAHTNSGSKP